MTRVRIVAAIAANVVYPGNSHRVRTSSSSATLIKSAELSFVCTAAAIACSAIVRTFADSYFTLR